MMFEKWINVLTLFTMWVLIINTNFATAGPGHFELQKYSPKRKLYEKNSCFNRDSNLGPQKLLIFWSNALPLDQADKT